MTVSKPARPIRFYGAKLSGHTHRVWLFLNFLQLAYEFIEVNADGRKEPAFLARSPLGQVPVIEDGEVVLCDSNAILVYLEMKYGDGSWLPSDPLAAARVQRWLSLATGEILRGPGFARLVKLLGAPLNLEQAQATAGKLFAVLEAELGTSGFAVGKRPTLADVAAYAYIARAPEGGIPLTPYPNIRAWLARIENLPHFVPMPKARA